MISRRCWCALIVAMVLGVSGNTHAADGEAAEGSASTDQRTRALELSAEARVAFDRGDFTKAAELLRRAHELYPAPELLYNLGRALESAGKDEEAVAAYEAYLERADDSESLAGIRRAVTNLKQRIAQRKRAEDDRRRALAKAREAERRSHRAGAEESVSPLPWVVTAVGVAGLATGAVFGVLAKRQESRAADEPTHEGATDEFERGESYATIANISLIAGGVLAAAGGVWLVVEHSGGDQRSLAFGVAGQF